jgi:hypothetical protein
MKPSPSVLAVEIALKHTTEKIRSNIIEGMVAKFLSEVEAKIRPEMEKAVGELNVKHVTRLAQAYRLDEELRITFELRKKDVDPEPTD